ncbi:DNA cytosine methyltransferase [Syntrophus buswellii]|jgi:DNA (cytosine-5)-methyltransferase 1|uniref:DNA cytosine methyltransferase n=1 Tax=Syntrophus buswellii TaxID=43774 RepID=UPI0038D37572
MKSIELFAGSGGLGLGLSLVGFEPSVVIEWDKWACDTIRENKKSGYPLVQGWEVHEGDVRTFDFSQLNDIDLVSGGPPCQPFSLGGKHKAFQDKRDMFPAAVDIVRKLAPRAFVFENVKGITRESFANYFLYILLQLSYPEVARKDNESWNQHLSRLEKHKTHGNMHGLHYNVVARLLNAANFGVPQQRERVFIVGFRSDQNRAWCFPLETHSLDALLHDQWITGEYWERHNVSSKKRPLMPEKYLHKVNKLRQAVLPGTESKPWRTTRDALFGLPDPQSSEARVYFNHTFQAGAKTYHGHTGSPLDLPSKTLKAGDHGVPGGENMMVLPDGSVRYFTVRESARLQTFPDCYRFHGSWTETMRQLGNAVPVILAKTVGASIAKELVRNREIDLCNKIKGLN